MKSNHHGPESGVQRLPMEQRRHLLRLLGGLGILGLAGPGASRSTPGGQPGDQVGCRGPRVLSLREADFYRPHDLAG